MCVYPSHFYKATISSYIFTISIFRKTNSPNFQTIMARKTCLPQIFAFYEKQGGHHGHFSNLLQFSSPSAFSCGSILTTVLRFSLDYVDCFDYTKGECLI